MFFLCLTARNRISVKYNFVIGVLLLLSQRTSAVETFPGFSNVASMKPITVEPAEATCGDGVESETFCRSAASRDSVSVCFEETCRLWCPYTWEIANFDVINPLPSEYSPSFQGSCVVTEAINHTYGTNALHFKALTQGSECAVSMGPIYYISSLLGPTWNVTFTMALRHEVEDGQSGTIYDIANSQRSPVLRFSLTGEQLHVISGTRDITRSEWRIPRNEWRHLAISVYEEPNLRSLTVYIDGAVAGQVDYSTTHLESRNNANLYTMGQTAAGAGTFKGYLFNFRIIVRAISNREVEEMISGSLPETRIESHCRCPAGYPLLKASDEAFCVRNPGSSQPSNAPQQYRIHQDSHPVQFVNDGKIDTFWISNVNHEEAKVIIDFVQIYEVWDVELTFYSPYPGVVILERQRSQGYDWEHWQLYSDDCARKLSYAPDAELTAPDEVNCKYLVQPNEELTFSNGRLHFDLTGSDREQWISSSGQLHVNLRAFMRARRLRVTLRDFPYVHETNHFYHGIYDITVNGTCDCNGHADGCDSGTCECSDDSYTDGATCDSCVADTYQLVDESSPYFAPCMPCACDPAGTVGASTTCNTATGQCPCKANVGSRACDTCLVGYYDLQASHADGCVLCDCEMTGVQDPNMPCDQDTGVCVCKPNVIGDRCDTCEAGHYGLSDTVSDCLACNCDAAGTVGDRNVCDTATGQCQCKTRAAGRRCDQCVDGYYNLLASNGDGCVQCNCDWPAARNTSCDLRTGACYCPPNVVGTECNECASGFYAMDANDFNTNGCTHDCNCSPEGTLEAIDTCEKYGGQCTCKANTEGSICDRCKASAYDFGGSDEFGCRACGCVIAGTVGASTQCDTDSGQCTCKSRVQSRACSTCLEGYFGLSRANVEGCQPCECHPLGTVENTTCDSTTGQCVCLPDQGSVQDGGRQCISYLSSVVPRHGPEAGGTVVTLSGGFLGDPTIATVVLRADTDLSCAVDLQASSTTQLVCVTPSVGGHTPDLKHRPLPIRVTLQDGFQIEAGNFTYMENPVIETLQPLRSIVSGGIIITVTGQYLNSVAFPRLQVSMVYTMRNGTTDLQVFETICSVTAATQMLCPTPEIELPRGFDASDVTGARRRRSNPALNPTALETENTRRQRRQASNADLDGYEINSEELQFYIGFSLDGVMEFRNMSTVDSQYGILRVYINPTFKTLDKEITVFQTYWPFNDKDIQIKGKQLNYGAQLSDYVMRVGSERCQHLELTTNQLTCYPPSSQPRGGPVREKKGAPAVTISVGNILFVAGYLRYERTFWDNTAFRWGVVGGLIAVVLLIALIVVCCCYRRKRCGAKSDDDKKFPHLQPFDDHIAYPEERPSQKQPQQRVINAYDENQFHFPTLNPEKRPDPNPRPVHTLPPPSSKHHNGTAASYLNPTLSPPVMDVLLPELRFRVQSVQILPEQLMLGKLISEGKLGSVHLGQLSDPRSGTRTTVLVKRLTEAGLVPREASQFLEETCALRDVKHHNVLRLCGVLLEHRDVMAVWPHAENGSLKSFITNEENMLTVGELIHFGQQVATGMMQLAERKMVHKDLAARNCVVTKDLVVQVSDSALSRSAWPEDYWRSSGMRRPLPVRWLALEALEIDVFTTKGDVWSFGILLWELLTRGCIPYPDQKNSSIKSFLLCGNRMDRPDFAPEEIYKLMLHCWDESPRDRPVFAEVRQRIADFLESQNTRTNLRNRGRQQVPSSRRRGHNNYAMLYE